jgi:hypothetical protein
LASEEETGAKAVIGGGLGTRKNGASQALPLSKKPKHPLHFSFLKHMTRCSKRTGKDLLLTLERETTGFREIYDFRLLGMQS